MSRTNLETPLAGVGNENTAVLRKILSMQSTALGSWVHFSGCPHGIEQVNMALKACNNRNTRNLYLGALFGYRISALIAMLNPNGLKARILMEPLPGAGPALRCLVREVASGV